MKNKIIKKGKLQSRYIVTIWTEIFDIDGLTDDFAVAGNFEDKSEAMDCAVERVEEFIRRELVEKTDWNPIVRDSESRTSYSKPNRMNKVVFSKTASRRDTTGYNSAYVFIEVIEVPHDTAVDETLFNVADCGFEVKSFFETVKKQKEKENMLLNLKKDRPQPTKCHLWNKSVLNDDDLDNVFDVVKTYTEDSHFSRRLVICKQCKQLYLKEFYEVVEWIDGNDSMYFTYIPVSNEQEAEIIAGVDMWEFQTFYPKIDWQWPKDKTIIVRWVGK